ncbi:MAG TPA: hypothetical protein VHZ28_08735 [Terracidiphilus sp.]|nr:hypothetical protein [Terracidiphilus sp.]
MTTRRKILLLATGLLVAAGLPCRAVQLKVDRSALERTLKQQLFSAPDSRYFLKGSPTSACWVYADDAHLRFEQNRILVRIKTHARLGESIRGACVGFSLAPTSEVALEPYGEGETIGFRNAEVIKVSDQRELNFLLGPFLSHQVPSSMNVNAAELLRKANGGLDGLFRLQGDARSAQDPLRTDRGGRPDC